MFLLVVVLLLVIPIAELWTSYLVVQQIGFGATLLALLLISIVGVYLCKFAGFGVLRRMQKTARKGQVPTAEVVDGFLVLLAGALLILPGFLSDITAILLLIPPTRAIARG